MPISAPTSRSSASSRPSSRQRTSRRRAKTALAVGLPLLVGLLLIGLAVPRTGAALWGLGSPYAWERQVFLKPLPLDQIAGAKASLETALYWQPSSQRLLELGSVELSEALALEAGDSRRPAVLESAEGHLVRSLALNPANPIAWYDLARVRLLQGAEGRQVAQALLESLYAGPGLRMLWLPRAELLMRYWRFLDEGELQAFQSQLRAISAESATDRSRLFEMALGLGEMRMAAAAIADDAAARQTFDRLKDELGVRSPRRPGPN